MSTSSQKTVAVTGASGFIASELVRQLLAKGYRVHGTVRDTQNASKVKHLRSLPGAAENLILFEADLLHPETLAPALAGTSAVFHTASPAVIVTDPARAEKELIKPAVKGTQNVMNVIASDPGKTIRTVIITGSIASIVYSHVEYECTEENWSDEAEMRAHGHFYQLSKTLAEKAVWKWVKDHPQSKLRVAVLNPGLVIGPFLQPDINVSTSLITRYLSGQEKEIDAGSMQFVDVRDVAELHIKALENENVTGRMLVTAEKASWKQVVDDLRKLRPNQTFPTQVKSTAVMQIDKDVNNGKARALLGKPFLPLEQSLKDMIESVEQ